MSFLKIFKSQYFIKFLRYGYNIWHVIITLIGFKITFSNIRSHGANCLICMGCRSGLKNKDDLQNENNFKSENDLTNRHILQNEDNLKNKDDFNNENNTRHVSLKGVLYVT